MPFMVMVSLMVSLSRLSTQGRLSRQHERALALPIGWAMALPPSSHLLLFARVLGARASRLAFGRPLAHVPGRL